jgi:hypothetical protein
MPSLSAYWGNIFWFLEHPDVMIGQALALKFKPVDLDVLPL